MKIPKTLHCSRCSYVTHVGIGAMAKHVRNKHPSAMRRKSPTKYRRGQRVKEGKIVGTLAFADGRTGYMVLRD